LKYNKFEIHKVCVCYICTSHDERGNGMSDKESMILKAAKAELTTDQRLMFDQEYEKKKKTMVAAYLLWFFLGGIGIHKFYLGRNSSFNFRLMKA
jgi:hypothetical protein